MYVEPWIFWLMLAPIAAVSAIYLGYLAMILLGLVSLTIGLGFSMPLNGSHRSAHLLGADGNMASDSPCRAIQTHGPWLDYAVVAGVALALSLGGSLAWRLNPYSALRPPGAP